MLAERKIPILCIALLVFAIFVGPRFVDTLEPNEHMTVKNVFNNQETLYTEPGLTFHCYGEVFKYKVHSK